MRIKIKVSLLTEALVLPHDHGARSGVRALQKVEFHSFRHFLQYVFYWLIQRKVVLVETDKESNVTKVIALDRNPKVKMNIRRDEPISWLDFYMREPHQRRTTVWKEFPVTPAMKTTDEALKDAGYKYE